MHEQLIEVLNAQGLEFILHPHQKLVSYQDAKENLPFPAEQMLKTLVLKKKTGGWLLVAVRGQDKLDFGKIARAAGVGRDSLIQPNAAEVEGELGFQVGGVCPVALRDDVEIILDETAASTLEKVYCGSGRNDVTLEINLSDLRRLSPMKLATVIK
jgi:Cys-tRNA(Pro)/Cys-tRNA(Cys) deacylase